MKKLLAITIALVMLLAAMPVFAAETTTEVPDSKFTGNIVLQDEYYDYYDKLIKANATQFDVYTADAFFTLAGMINADANGFAGKTVSLKCDLIFNEGNAADWETTAPAFKWTAIDNFKGTFDGEGHTISGIYMKTPAGTNYKGLFGVLKDNATVKNFAIVNSYFENDHEYGNGVIGRINAEGVTVRDIYADIIVKGDSTTATGGIIGLVTNTGATEDKYAIIEGLVFAGTVKDTCETSGYVGGIVGHAAQYQYNHCVIRDCLNIGTVTGRRATGAIIARGSTVTIERCVNLGTVESTDVTDPTQATQPDPFYLDGAMGGKLGTSNAAAVVKLNVADCYNLSSQIMSDYNYEVPANQTVKVITKDGVKGDAAKTVLTALDFAGTDATKTDWVTRANDTPVPAAIATILAGVANVADPNAKQNDNNNDNNNDDNNENNIPAETVATTTKAPETTKAAETTAAATTAAAEEKSGCGATIGIASLAVLAVAGGVTFVATKKKED